MSARVVRILRVVHSDTRVHAYADLMFIDRGDTFRCAVCLGDNAHNPATVTRSLIEPGKSGFIGYMNCDACADVYSSGNDADQEQAEARANANLTSARVVAP